MLLFLTTLCTAIWTMVKIIIGGWILIVVGMCCFGMIRGFVSSVMKEIRNQRKRK